jgi:hypothetical protein
MKLGQAFAGQPHLSSAHHVPKVAATLAAAHVVVHQQAATPVVATTSHLTKSLSRLSIFFTNHTFPDTRITP